MNSSIHSSKSTDSTFQGNQPCSLAITLKVTRWHFSSGIYNPPLLCNTYSVGGGFARHQAFQQEKCHLPCSHSCLCIEAFRSYLFCWGPNHGLNMGVFLHGYYLNVSRQTWIIASSGPNISSYTFCDLKKESKSGHSWGLQCKVLKVRLSLKSKIKLKINNKNIFHISFLPLHQVLKF